jgi:tripartite-type tricarboxylate transporter receptor subunit TctC
VIARLKTALAQVMASPTMQEAMKNLNVLPYDGKLEDLPKLMEKELTEFTEDQKKQGILPQ